MATLAGLIPHYAAHYLANTPLLTDTVAEWIMARTPNHQAVWMLEHMGPWAKPFAVTGALAALGFCVWLTRALMEAGQAQRGRNLLAASVCPSVAVLAQVFGYSSWTGLIGFCCGTMVTLAVIVDRSGRPPRGPTDFARRELLTSAVMSTGVAAVAVESYLRNSALAHRAVEPQPLYSFRPPDRSAFAPGMVRKPITPVGEFYVMSKNTVDPQIDPHHWRMQIKIDDQLVRTVSYEQLLSLPRTERYVTLRCVSNNLVSDLVGTASWTGIQLSQLIDPRSMPADTQEVAIIGVDGHGDSVSPGYLFQEEPLFALGMNGKTLNRNHGYPVRLLAPSYYGFRSVKWIQEIQFRRIPYFGTWAKLGFTKDPLHQIASHIDKMRLMPNGLLVGGIAFAGTRAIRRVRVRADQGPWVDATLEPPLSPYTLTRWYALLPATRQAIVQAQAQDVSGRWQEEEESPLYPEGVKGPTRRRFQA